MTQKNKNIKRVITITLEIRSKTHKGKATYEVTENGKLKEDWTPPQVVSTAMVLADFQKYLLENLVTDLIKKGSNKEDKK